MSWLTRRIYNCLALEEVFLAFIVITEKHTTQEANYDELKVTRQLDLTGTPKRLEVSCNIGHTDRSRN